MKFQFENQLRDSTGVFVDPISKTSPDSLPPVLSSYFHINILDDPEIYVSSYVAGDFNLDGIEIENEYENFLNLEKKILLRRKSRNKKYLQYYNAEYRRRYYNNNKDKLLQYRKEKRKNVLVKKKESACSKLHHAIRYGRISKPNICSICNIFNNKICGHQGHVNGAGMILGGKMVNRLFLTFILLCILVACGSGSSGTSEFHIMPPVYAQEPIDVNSITGLNHILYGLYNSGNKSELLNILPVDREWRVIYSIGIKDLDIGDVLHATTHFEGTNDLDYRTMWTMGIILADSPQALSGFEITERGGYNCTPDLHHCTISKSGDIYITGGMLDNAYVNVVVRSGSTVARNGDYLIIENDYGRLSVMQFKGVR